MGEVYEYGGGDIVGHVDATVRSVANYASYVQGSLDDIRDNTKTLYWWTSTLVYICLGLFLLAQLVRLRHELQTVNQYQELYLRMWDEDRRTERARIEEEKREKQIEEQNRKARVAARYVREGRENRGGMAAQGGSPPSSSIDNAQDAVSPAGPAKSKVGTSSAPFSSGVNSSPWRTPPQGRGSGSGFNKPSGSALPPGPAQPNVGTSQASSSSGANSSPWGTSQQGGGFGSGVNAASNSTLPPNPPRYGFGTNQSSFGSQFGSSVGGGYGNNFPPPPPA